MDPHPAEPVADIGRIVGFEMGPEMGLAFFALFDHPRDVCQALVFVKQQCRFSNRGHSQSDNSVEQM
jgi:hypothetical protein